MSFSPAIAILSKKSKAEDECPSAGKPQRKESGDRSQEIKETIFGGNSESGNPEFRRSILRRLDWRYFSAPSAPHRFAGILRGRADCSLRRPRADYGGHAASRFDRLTVPDAGWTSRNLPSSRTQTTP